jgi:hypothetical protein
MMTGVRGNSLLLRRTNTALLESTSEDEEDAAEDSSLSQEKIFKRQDRLQIGLKVTSITYLAIAIWHVAKKGLNYWSLYYALAGPLLVSGVSNILKGAASSDRLSSDTYKRLNLALIKFGVLGLSLPILDPEHFQTPLFIIPPLLVTIQAIKGYGYGVLGWDKAKESSAIVTDLKEAIRSTIDNLKTFKKESLDYLLATAMVGGMTLVKTKEVLELLLSGNSNPLMLASRVSRLARLTLFTTILYTLKEAADRDRLSGTTFIQLNYLSSAAFFSMAGEYYNRK